MSTWAKATTRGSLRVVAALLLVDGRCLSTDELAMVARPWGGDPGTLWEAWMPALRSAGCAVEHVRGVGYRLVALPPDDLLDDVLTVSRQLRREYPTRLWHLMGQEVMTVRSRTRAIA